jgi:Flp pilus assembly protein TadD
MQARDMTALLDRAAACYAQGRLDDAADLYRQAAAADPKDLRPIYSLALLDIRRGRLQNARILISIRRSKISERFARIWICGKRRPTHTRARCD